MIDLNFEKSRTLTMPQVCSILDFAIQAANDGGFLNHYIYERAIIVFAATVLYPEKKDEITAMIGKDYDIRMAFDALLENGIVEEMCEKYQNDLNYLAEIGIVWFDDVKTYEHSARGLLDTISTLSGDIVQSAVQKLQEIASGDVQVINEFADKWGANNGLALA